MDALTHLHHRKTMPEEIFKDLSTTNPWVLPVFLDNIRLFKYEFPFFVLLIFLISFFIFPTQQLTTIRTVNISNFVQSSYQKPLFFGT